MKNIRILDGDQITAKVAFTVEANEELDKYIKSKAYYIGVDGKNVRVSQNEAVQAIYNLTKVLPESDLTKPIFKG